MAAAVEVLVQLVPAEVVEGLELAAVLVDLPGEEVVEAVPFERRAGEEVLAHPARLGEDLLAPRQPRRARALVGVVEGAVVVAFEGVGVGLLVALQVVPAGVDDPPEAVDERPEGAGGRVVEEPQVAARRIEAPEAGVGRHLLVLVELRVEVALARARAVGGEDHAAVGAVDRADVVGVGRLAGELAHLRRLTRGEAGHLVDLPPGGDVLVALGRGADDHAEEGLRPGPIDGGLTHRDGARALEALDAEAGLFRQVPQLPARVEDPEVAAAAGGVDVRQVVAEDRADGREVRRDRHLRHEEDGVGERGGGGRGQVSGRRAAGGGDERAAGEEGEGPGHGVAASIDERA